METAPSPGGAFWRSAALPGWGQFYNGRPIRGLVYGGVVAVCAGMAVRNWDRALGTYESGSLFWKRRAWTRGRNNWLILGGVTYILCAVDAYVDAHLQTFDVEPVAGGSRDHVFVGISMHLPPVRSGMRAR